MNNDNNLENQKNNSVPTENIQTPVTNVQEQAPTIEQNNSQDTKAITSNTVMSEKQNDSNLKTLLLFVIVLVVGVGLVFFLEKNGKDDDSTPNSPTASPTISTPTPEITPSATDSNVTNDVLNKKKQETFGEIGLSIINSIRQRLVLENKLNEGTYWFDKNILEANELVSPFGGSILVGNLSTNGGELTSNESGIYWKAGTTTCSPSSNSFVTVTEDNGRFRYSICLTAGADNAYIDNAPEEDLLSYKYDLIKLP